MAEAGRWEPRRRARRRALQAIYQWQLTSQPAGDIVGQFLATQDFGNVDEALFRDLVAGVARQAEALETRLQAHLDRPFGECDVMERVVLLMGAWQVLFDTDTPWQVVLEESVDLAKRFGSAQSPVFVNGVLDKAVKAWVNSTSSG